ncbi:Vacuolar protein sorting-associated protein 45 [Dictyocoela muelleri]|nr:Vacuolar protein sorting-associated protein 45 [Dictyocoela muelleri]
MNDGLFSEKVKYILSLGKGAKICLFDEESKEIYSNLIEYSKFLENNFFIFEMINNKREKMDLNCVVFLNSANLQYLLKELKTPAYPQYTIIFNDNITDKELEDIAICDNNGIVSGIYESHIEVIRRDNFLYTCKDPFKGILSILKTLEIFPKICIQSGYNENIDWLTNNKEKKNDNYYKSKICVKNLKINYNFANIHSQIHNEMRNFKFKSKGKLIFLDRLSDPFTPLIYNWRYLPMIKEYMDFEYVVKSKKTYTLNDTFFDINKFEDIYTVYNNLKEYRKTNNSDVFNVKEKNEILEKHLDITNQILKECIKNKEISEIEMQILKGSFKGDLKKIFKFEKKQIFKCLIIYCVRNIYNYKEILIKFPEFRPDVEKFLKTLNHVNILVPKFRNDVDIKLGFEPPLVRVIERFIKGRNDRFFDTDSNYCDGPLILFLENVTYLEYYFFQEIGKKYKILIYIISNKIISFNDIIKYKR